MIAWDLERDVIAIGGGPGSSACPFEMVHVPVLNALAAFERIGGRFFGVVRLPALEFVPAEKEQKPCSFKGKIFVVDDGPLLFCGFPQLYADRDESLIGVCLFDPTPGKESYFGRITFEVPAHSISRLGRRQFGILFSDGSTGVVRVNP